MTPEQEQLVLDNMRLVHHIAKKYTHRLSAGNSYDHDDLISEGMIALIKAAERFDETKEVKFATYASNYIHGYMKDFVNYDVSTAKFNKKIIIIANKMIMNGLVDLDDDQIAEILESPLNDIKMAKAFILNKQCKSFDEPVGNDDKQVPFGDTLALKHEVDFDTQLILNEFMDNLDAKERAIIDRMKAGLSQIDIAKELGVTQSWVSRIIQQIMEKAKQYGEGEIMSKINQLRKKIPKDILKALLLENKTSKEISELFDCTRSDIEVLKRDYKLTKEQLGISVHDRNDPIEEEKQMIKPEEKPMVKPEEVKDITIGVKNEASTPTASMEPSWLSDLFGQEGRIVINAQSMVINIGA